MKFNLQQNGKLKFKVFFPMTNYDIKQAILNEITLQRMKLSGEEQNAVKTYLNALKNEDLYVDPEGEMELSYGFKN